MPRKAKRRKNTNVISHTDPNSKELVYKIDTKRRRGKYYLRSNGQSRWASSITLSGFSRLPSGLKKNGGGLPSGGYLLLRYLSEELKRFELIIDAEKTSRIQKSNRHYKVTLNHNDLRRVLRVLRAVNSEYYDERRSEVFGFLNQCFPKRFKAVEKDKTAYSGGELSRVLDKRQLVENLAPKDIDSLSSFFPEFIKEYGDRLKGQKKLLALTENKRAVEVVYIQKVIRRYERKLRAKSHVEQSWQDFLREYILLFTTNYASTLEKESVTFKGKYPDFLLIDAYNYLDIYEIKKPNTNLLKEDKSRGNFYWDTELSKAISQVENYIAYAERHGADLREQIKKHKGIEIRVLKPRGFIIGGTRKQLKGELMEDNFRLLNNSLKNIEVILYDELLSNLKNFLKRIKKD